MKIAHVVCVFPPYKSGISNTAYKLAELSALHGHEVTVFTPDYGHESGLKSDFFYVARLKPFLKYGNAAFIPGLISVLSGFDIVHLHYPFFGGDIPVWFLKVVLKKKFRFFLHYHMDVAGLPFYMRPFSWPSKLIFPSLVRSAEKITCASLDYIANSSIRKIYEVNKDKFYELPFGVDLETFRPLENSHKDANRILFVGGLDSAHYFKGLNVLFKALARINNLDWKLDIIGQGNLREEYERQTRELNIEDKIHFLGGIDGEKFYEAYRKAGFFVLPAVNRNEAFGIVLLEAMASGTAVIASDLPGVRAVFEDGKQGLLFKTDDASDLEKKIREMLGLREKTIAMGREGRILAQKKYDWKRIGDELGRLYHDQ
jgi:glycosyltransferase involved in cell wall biosynthesis